jgi:hypothetical protein
LTDALEERLIAEFTNASAQARYLFTCRFTKVMKLNLLLLKIFLGKRSETGMFVSVDRPHSYTYAALKKQGVPQHGIIYIDIISKLTGINTEETQVKFTASGYAPKILSDYFSRAYIPEGAMRHFINLDEMNFIIVDNIGVMLQYATMDRVKKFTADLLELLKKYASMRAVFIVDPEAAPEVHSYLKGFIEKEIPVMEEWL